MLRKLPCTLLSTSYGGVGEHVRGAVQGLPAAVAGAAGGSAGGDAAPGAPGALDFLRSNPQFRALRGLVQTSPAILQPMLQELGKQNPQLLRLINENQVGAVWLLLRWLPEPLSLRQSWVHRWGDDMLQWRSRHPQGNDVQQLGVLLSAAVRGAVRHVHPHCAHALSCCPALGITAPSLAFLNATCQQYRQGVAGLLALHHRVRWLF